MTTSERLRRGRGTAIGEGLTWAARWSLRVILVAAGAFLIWTVIGLLWSVIFPVILAVIITTVLWPPTSWLRKHGFPPALASATVLLAGMVVLAGLITLIATSVAGSVPEITRSASSGLTAIQQWLAGPQVDFARGELDAVLQNITTQLQQSLSTITTGVLAGLGSVASGVVTALLTLVLVFLFLKDGPRFLPWLLGVAGEGAGSHLAEVLRRVWKTVSDFIRVQAIVALVDSVLIGLGLVILGVPLAVPLAVITFIGAFIPIVGAIVAGALGVLVALVSNGFTTALIVLAIIVAVQQLEGNVMQPILQGRSLRLHAAVVLLAVTAGGTLFGIAGAFLSVPVAAAGAVVLRYLSERIDARAGGETAPRVDPPLESLQAVLSVPNAPSPDGSVPDPDAPEPVGPATHIPDPAPEDQDESNRDGSPEADTDAAKRDDPRH
ncbi:AI-2E family transporter [Pseudonocardia alaniniphila]|uniref:AI-2E family transporter n=1 Tax=Pseudonocardia alaniniphila TaxID=75291 RepID=A0ABS9TPY9_9PSEU|nr:AI-2E family transporter [Pseudonocardia alaniniphila]MCH6170611.1 AI-2E family transporter [Pseudonocardia alaniniphila]